MGKNFQHPMGWAGDINRLAQLGAPERGAIFRDHPGFDVFHGAWEAEIIVGFSNARAPFDELRRRRVAERLRKGRPWDDWMLDLPQSTCGKDAHLGIDNHGDNEER